VPKGFFLVIIEPLDLSKEPYIYTVETPMNPFFKEWYQEPTNQIRRK